MIQRRVGCGDFELARRRFTTDVRYARWKSDTRRRHGGGERTAAVEASNAIADFRLFFALGKISSLALAGIESGLGPSVESRTKSNFAVAIDNPNSGSYSKVSLSFCVRSSATNL